MSGSFRAFNYLDDEGQTWLVKLDESNSKGVAQGGILFPSAVSAAPQLPRGLRMRYFNCVNTANPLQKRQLKCGSPTIFNGSPVGTQVGTPAGDGHPAITWQIVSKRGERVSGISLVDTGLTDGSAD